MSTPLHTVPARFQPLRCPDCDPLACGIFECQGHVNSEAYAAWLKDQERRRRQRREKVRRLWRRFAKLYGPVLCRLVREILAADLPAALAVLLRQRRDSA
jgi:hypothetical protein